MYVPMEDHTCALADSSKSQSLGCTSKKTKQSGSTLGLPGGSRFPNHVPRDFLCIMDQLTVQQKLSESISERSWMKYVIVVC